jgi:hypothetical protein
METNIYDTSYLHDEILAEQNKTSKLPLIGFGILAGLALVIIIVSGIERKKKNKESYSS